MPFHGENMGVLMKTEEVNYWRQRAEKAEAELQELRGKIEKKIETLELLPSPASLASRFTQFREKIFACYAYLNDSKKPQWDASDAKCLEKFLKANAELTVDEFRNWLYNFIESENINPAWRPRRLISNIAEYRNGPLNEYGRPLVKKRRVL